MLCKTSVCMKLEALMQILNGEKYWDITIDLSQKPLETIQDDELLPSDCRYRIDRGFLIQDDMESAEKSKKVMEEMQRREAKLRNPDRKQRKIKQKNQRSKKKEKLNSKMR